MFILALPDTVSFSDSHHESENSIIGPVKFLTYFSLLIDCLAVCRGCYATTKIILQETFSLGKRRGRGGWRIRVASLFTASQGSNYAVQVLCRIIRLMCWWHHTSSTGSLFHLCSSGSVGRDQDRTCTHELISQRTTVVNELYKSEPRSYVEGSTNEISWTVHR